MKKIFFFMLCISKFLVSSDTFTLFKHERLRRSCVSIHNYLETFYQEYRESHELFLARMKSEHDSCTITDEPRLIITDGKNSVERPCGYWGGDKKTGFYIGSSCLVKGKNASLAEKGNYHWVIDAPAQLSGEEFANPELQCFLKYVVGHRGIRLQVPVISYDFDNEKLHGKESEVIQERKHISIHVEVEDVADQRLKITTRLSGN
jgi:hypothetical protein